MKKNSPEQSGGSRSRDKKKAGLPGANAGNRDESVPNDAELRFLARQWESFLRATTHPIMILDPEFRIIAANKATCETLGIAKEELFGEKCCEMFHGTREPAPGCPMKTMLQQGCLETVEMEVETVRGTFLVSCIPIFDASQRLAGVVHMATDITRQKKAEEALRESEERYRSIAEESLVGVYIIQDNLFRYVNKRFCEISGYGYDEIVDRMTPLDLTHEDDRRTVEDNLKRCFQGEIDSIRYGFRIKRKDGRIARVEVIGGLFDYRGRPATIGTLLDITKETMLEEQLQQAQKMEAIGQLAGGIAHDFNNILTTVTGYCGLLQMDMKKDDPNVLYVDQIRIASEKAAQFTSSLLAFSRKQVMELKPQRFNTLIKGVEKLLERLLPEDVMLKIIFTGENSAIIADSTQIYQLLMNLTANARDAMPRGGALTIETDTVVIDEDFIAKRGFGENGCYALLSVSDIGTGMDARTKERVFEPFFTTKGPGKGTGLGLSVVYGIVKQHGGFIDVESEPGKGTTFFVYLPIVKVKMDRRYGRALIYKGGNETVLIAEDSNDVRDLTKEVLKKAGYSVIEAVDGQQAISVFRENPDNIDLVILDVVMPKKNGREVYNEIILIRPEVKVLFISGYTADVIIDKGISDRSLEYLAKPVSPVLLLKKVREILDRT